ncbi:hypothetical protein GCM10029978_037150 [Actinoallomurus acanthiterrae]
MFTFPADPQATFDERAPQFAAWGIPRDLIARARADIHDMWGTGPGGWVPVWASHAERAERDGAWLRAALLWGAARFPSLATEERQAALERQLAAYRRVRFPVRFERRVLEVPYGDGATPVPVHLFERNHGRRRGILVLSGGVDTWKVELHRLAVTTARATGLLVAALDMPGTGESRVPLDRDGDRVLAGVVAALRETYAAPIGFLGLSFGGHWAAKLAMLGDVDAAVDIGGPTGLADEPVDVLNLPYGMAGIVGNAMGLDALPAPDEVPKLLERFSLRRLAERPGTTPLLAANGAHDQYIPRGDTTGLARRPHTTVWIVRDATHCAPEHFRPLVVAAWGWLLARLAPERPAVRLAEPLLTAPVRRLLAA